MDRRKALKNMGLAMGYTVAAPTLISIMQGCKTESVAEWTPDFFSKEQGAILIQLVDIILPKTDTPSASEMQVHLFIDRFADQAMEPEQQEFVKMVTGKFMEKALKDAGQEKLGDLTSEQLEKALASLLKITKEDQVKNMEALQKYNEAVASGDTDSMLDDGVSAFAFANNLRDLTIWGYKTSEYVGEEVMEYLPVPGEYIGCGDLQELTGGKAWSL
ncbi:gluconate 2-dehydrogenase subunit 3 family protein [Flavobacteriaceae bacterium TP-CH-4]|uniref:Gluconate 2-dehydrogenase subunit 3 family protein n=1 Tax=Pelagihabitans pacificus TaxID=2696054 RepID=A0A967E7N5_9FLAO|nr:gluconate 2-dehydrogenase subunit 3 family protein [Pelagihabitans pacificus]NHF60439.1 gluconate 2-dehydrogenase subunit 3 family protein [Pelagihabitans pacificus]